MPESQVEDTLKDLIDGQTNPTIATYAKTGEVHIRVTASGEDTKAAGKAIKPVVKELKSRFGADIYSTKAETTLEMAVADLLMANDLTVTTAESCTGGMIAARIINVPGVSECYKAGLVTYSNKAKRKFLGVRKSTLDKYGAVSSKTASEMAKRSRTVNEIGCGCGSDRNCGTGRRNRGKAGRTGIYRMQHKGRSYGERVSFLRNPQPDQRGNYLCSTDSYAQLYSEILQ